MLHFTAVDVQSWANFYNFIYFWAVLIYSKASYSIKSMLFTVLWEPHIYNINTNSLIWALWQCISTGDLKLFVKPKNWENFLNP